VEDAGDIRPILVSPICGSAISFRGHTVVRALKARWRTGGRSAGNPAKRPGWRLLPGVRRGFIADRRAAACGGRQRALDAELRLRAYATALVLARTGSRPCAPTPPVSLNGWVSSARPGSG